MAVTRNGWWRAGALAAGIALAIAPLSSAGASDASNRAVAPLLGTTGADVIAGRYIVVLDDGATDDRVESAAAVATAAGGTVGFTYTHALKGFSAALPAAALAAVRAADGVKYVEADARVHPATNQPNPPSWGLDRVDQRDLPLSNKYSYVKKAGAGVDIYVIDTGMRFTHSDFGGRASSGFDAIDGGSADDCNGHGTHVTGTAGGKAYGVAKKASLIAVRVFDCGGSGTWEGVIAGVDWVTANHSGPSVANMSIQGGKEQSVNDAITNSIISGVVYAVAAANFSDDACAYSPASTQLAITVGATTISDARASFSNYGTCLDLFAPGENITSDWIGSDTATNTISGTSMASPHVAGVAALYLSKHPNANTTRVRDAIVNNATTGKVTDPGTGSPNRLLYSKVNKYA
jgi:subtilisin family serine protease